MYKSAFGTTGGLFQHIWEKTARRSDRLRFANVIALLLGLLIILPAFTATSSAQTRSLKLYYLHTGERATITYKRGGKYIKSGLKKINWFLRDWRRNEPTKMDPRLLDLVWEVYRESGSKKHIHVISGYRSPKTNSMLRKRGRGVASKSQHTVGKALDFYLPDVKLSKLRRLGLIKQIGGVGYYPKSGSPFVHLDTGRVRHWPKMSRRELARVFPKGKTLHVPSDGKPLKGYNIAKANFEKKKRNQGKIVVTNRPEPEKPKKKTPTKRRPGLFQRIAKGADEIEENKSDQPPAPKPVKTSREPAPVTKPEEPVEEEKSPAEILIAKSPAEIPVPESAPRIAPEVLVAEAKPPEQETPATNLPKETPDEAVAVVAEDVRPQIPDQQVAVLQRPELLPTAEIPGLKPQPGRPIVARPAAAVEPGALPNSDPNSGPESTDFEQQEVVVAGLEPEREISVPARKPDPKPESTLLALVDPTEDEIPAAISAFPAPRQSVSESADTAVKPSAEPIPVPQPKLLEEREAQEPESDREIIVAALSPDEIFDLRSQFKTLNVPVPDRVTRSVSAATKLPNDVSGETDLADNNADEPLAPATDQNQGIRLDQLEGRFVTETEMASLENQSLESLRRNSKPAIANAVADPSLTIGVAEATPVDDLGTDPNTETDATQIASIAPVQKENVAAEDVANTDRLGEIRDTIALVEPVQKPEVVETEPTQVASLSPIEPGVSTQNDIAVPFANPDKQAQRLAILERLASANAASTDLIAPSSFMVFPTKRPQTEGDFEETQVASLDINSRLDETFAVSAQNDIGGLVAISASLDRFSMPEFNSVGIGRFVLTTDRSIRQISEIRSPAYGRNAIRQLPSAVLNYGFERDRQIWQTEQFISSVPQRFAFFGLGS